MLIFATFVRFLMHLWPAAFVAATPGARILPRAYVPNEDAGSISVIDTRTDEVVETWNIGGRPHAVAVSQDGMVLWVGDRAGNALRLFDTYDAKLVRSVSLRESPDAVVLSPDGGCLAAAVDGGRTVLLVDTAAQRVVDSVVAEGSAHEHAAFSPDGRMLFVAADGDGHLDVIDVGARRRMARLVVGPRPRGIGFSADGRRAYVACEGDGSIYGIDVRELRVVSTTPVGGSPNGIAVQPDGRSVWISSKRRSAVRLVDVDTPARARRGQGRVQALDPGAHAGRLEALRRPRAAEFDDRDRRAVAAGDRRDSSGRDAARRGDLLSAICRPWRRACCSNACLQIRREPYLWMSCAGESAGPSSELRAFTCAFGETPTPSRSTSSPPSQAVTSDSAAPENDRMLRGHRRCVHLVASHPPAEREQEQHAGVAEAVHRADGACAGVAWNRAPVEEAERRGECAGDQSGRDQHVRDGRREAAVAHDVDEVESDRGPEQSEREHHQHLVDRMAEQLHSAFHVGFSVPPTRCGVPQARQGEGPRRCALGNGRQNRRTRYRCRL